MTLEVVTRHLPAIAISAASRAAIGIAAVAKPAITIVLREKDNE